MAEPYVARLRAQIQRAEPVLFYGAGLSQSAKNQAGDGVPNSTTLSAKLWAIAFPSDPFDEEARLQDTYRAAQKQDPKRLAATLRPRPSAWCT